MLLLRPRRAGAGRPQIAYGHQLGRVFSIASAGSAARAWRSTRRGSLTPFHSLTSSVNVASAGSPSATGRRAPVPKATPRARARGLISGLEREAQVLALPHRAQVAERGVLDEQRDPRGCRARMAPARAAPRRAPSRAARTPRRRRRAPAAPCPRGRARLGVRGERLRELLHAPAFDLQARGGAMAAEAAQVTAAGGQAAEQVERVDAPPGALAEYPRRGRSALPGDGGARPGARRRSRSRPRASPRPRARRRGAGGWGPMPRPALRLRSGYASRPADDRGWRD